MVNHLASALLIAWIKSCALVYSVDPSFAQAVAIVESRAPGGGELEMRVGRLGRSKYWGPMGLNQDCFKDKKNVSDPFLNVYWGVKALARYPADEIRSLKKYNSSYNNSYYKEIVRLKKKLKNNKYCDIKITSRSDVASTGTALTTTKPLGRFRQ